MNVRKGKAYSISSLSLESKDLKLLKRVPMGGFFDVEDFRLEKLGVNKVKVHPKLVVENEC